MPKNWITRTLELGFINKSSPLQLFPIWLITGPRQVGKSSLLQHMGQLHNRNYISLDDLETRNRINYDPISFLKELHYPVTIDEIQYAPQLLSGFKQRADRYKIPGDIWLSGSQSFEVMRGVQESLAGRVAILNLFGLSDIEKNRDINNPNKLFNQILETSFPKLFQIKDDSSRNLFLSSYIQTYIERDVKELLGIQKRRQFEIFIQLCALRTGQIINFDEIAKDAGISPVTAKDWVGVLEDSFLIKLVYPYFNNRSKRLIKRPKLYFLDPGLAIYLAGLRTVEQIKLSPMAGALFETHVFSNIIKVLSSVIKDFQIHFWRTKDQQEIDFLVEINGTIVPIEVKLGGVHLQELVKLKSVKANNWQTGIIVSMSNQSKIVNSEWQMMSLANCLNYLIK